MKTYAIILIFALSFLVVIGCAAAVGKDDLLKALDSALADGTVDASEKTYLLSLLDAYLGSAQPLGSDLTITSLTTEPASPVPGDYVAIKAVVKNIGTTKVSLGSSQTMLSIDGVDVRLIQPGADLGPGENYTFVFDNDFNEKQFVWATPGVHEIRVETDSNHAITETNEGNNVRTESFAMGPDLVITDLSLWPAAPKVDDYITLYVQLENKGNQNITKKVVRLQASEAGMIVNTTETELTIPAGATYTWDIPAFLKYSDVGLVTLNVTIDTENVVVESHEDNNNVQKTFAVIAR